MRAPKPAHGAQDGIGAVGSAPAVWPNAVDGAPVHVAFDTTLVRVWFWAHEGKGGCQRRHVLGALAANCSHPTHVPEVKLSPLHNFPALVLATSLTRRRCPLRRWMA